MQKLLILVGAIMLAGWLQSGASLAAGAPGTTQTVSGGGVTVRATYLNPRTGENPRFQVALDTHSVALDEFNLKTRAVLRDGRGNSFSPTKVENEGGGHHRKVIMIFPKLSPETKSIEVVIQDLAGVKERSFRWSVE